MNDYYVHESAIVDDGVQIGSGTKIWHFSHVCKGATIGRQCIFGQGCYVDRNVDIGDNVKIQNGVSIYTGVHVENHAFLGPHCVFTNVITPRSAFPRTDPEVDYQDTWVRRGASIGANATIRCGIELGEWCLIGSGAVVAKTVIPHAIMVGVPAKQVGWACLCAGVLSQRQNDGQWVCPEANCNREFEIINNRVTLAHTPEHARPMVELD